MYKIFIHLLLFATNIYGQDTIISSNLKEIVITSYFKPEEQFYQPVSSAVIDSVDLYNSRDQSLIPVANLKAGIRMEERSPGSYRFSVRGSLLRSPFGIRNVKFYLNEFPLTDAGGNTYFNLFDHTLFTGIEILKGPDGSIFGANSGGVTRLLLAPPADTLALQLKLNSGSFGEAYQSVRVNLIKGKHRLTIFESYRRNDGYRMNSALKKFNAMIYDNVNLSEKLSLDAFGFFSNLNYRTPGGLTMLQAENDPRQARPRTATLPSARDQHSGIENRTGWGGAQLKYKINQRFTFLIDASTTYTDFKNPFITNYETRIESGANGRSWFMAENKNVNLFRYKLVAGIEFSKLQSNINNFENNSGNRGSLISSDKITNQYLVLFGSAHIFIGDKIGGQISVSQNQNSAIIRSIFPDEIDQEIKYKAQLMPKFSFSYSPKSFLIVRGVLSKGYSVPTTAELRPSGNVINTDLQPETGWNHEAGIRVKTKNKFFYTDISVFKYVLSNTISRRTLSDDTEFFLNSGKTSQKGLEVQTNFNFSVSDENFISLNIGNGITLYNFRFVDFISGETDLTGKKLTGVPEKTISSSLEISKKEKWNFSISHFFTGKILLNDLNSDSSPECNLINFKAEKYFKGKTFLWTIYFQLENVTNEFYSSGYDLNAFGGRYYNPAPGRSFYAGISIEY